MSRPINTSDSLSFVPTVYSDNTFGSSYYQNLDNGLSGSNSTTYAAFAMRNTSYHIYYDFSVSGIPSSATITSVTCSVKGYVYSSSYYPSVRLYSGTTAKGSASNITSTSSSNVQNITAGTWTVSELENARLYIVVAARYSRGSLSNSYFRFYGATLTVNYSLSGTEYEVSFTNTSENVTSNPSTTQYIFQGGNQEISFYNISSLDDVEITDNTNDIESQLVHNTSISKTDNCIPASLSGSNGTVTDANNGLTDVTSNTYSQLLLRSGTYIEYSFDTSNIPSNATITSISCQVKGCVTRTSNAATAQLYSGSTAKGSTSYLSYNSNVTTINLTCGTWTASELQNARIRIVSTYTNSSNYYARFYGATITVNYTIPEDVYVYTISNISTDHVITINNVSSAGLPIRVKQNGTWVTASKLFIKQNGTWVQSTNIKVKNNGTWK